MGAWVCGLDLGQAQDYTALCAVECTPGAVSQGVRQPTTYAVRHLERFALGTSYVAVADRLRDLFSREPLGGCTVAADATGVGRGVVDFLQRAGLGVGLSAITITSGHAVTVEGNRYTVPKRDLVAVMQLLLQSRRLSIAPALKEAAVLRRELSEFRVKVTVHANEVFESWRERDHDDLVLSVALACWLAERRGVGRETKLSDMLPDPHERTLLPVPPAFRRGGGPWGRW